MNVTIVPTLLLSNALTANTGDVHYTRDTHGEWQLDLRWYTSEGLDGLQLIAEGWQDDLTCIHATWGVFGDPFDVHGLALVLTVDEFLMLLKASSAEKFTWFMRKADEHDAAQEFLDAADEYKATLRVVS